jgi:hypothetical protein
MCQQIDQRVGSALERTGRRGPSDERTTSASPDPPTDKTKAGRAKEGIDAIEWRDDPALGAGVACTDRGERQDLTRLVHANVGHAPTATTNAYEIARSGMKFLHRVPSARAQKLPRIGRAVSDFKELPLVEQTRAEANARNQPWHRLERTAFVRQDA